MEELIGQLSAGFSNILFLVGLSEEKPSSSQHLLFHISQIQKKCRQVFVVLFVNREEDVVSSNRSSNSGNSRCSSIDTSSLNKDQVITIDCNQSSNSPTLQHWLKLCKYTFLIDMYFSIEKASGHLSPMTAAILQHFSASQADIKIICLHSETILNHNNNERVSGKRKKKPNNSKPANDPAKIQGIKTLTSAFEGLTISHMVGDPQQVLSLMSWSVDTLHHLSYDIMRMTPPEAGERGSVPTDLSPVTLAPAGSYSLHCVSEVFLPLLKQSLDGGVPPHSPDGLTLGAAHSAHSMTSIADSMLEMSSPERSQHCMKRFREDDSNGGGSSERGGTALKRSHTLSTIQESSSPAMNPDHALPRFGGGGAQALPRQGHALKRSLSEGKAVRAHPPRPPPASHAVGAAVGTQARLGGGDEYGRTHMPDEGFSNDSGGSFEWPSWRSEPDNESLLSASQLSVGSPSQQGLPDSQRSGHGMFRHIFSQEDRDRAGVSASAPSKVVEGNGLLTIPPQSLVGSHALVLPPGSPGAPLFMMNESSNHSQLSLGKYGEDEGDCNYQYNDTNDNQSNSYNGQSKSRIQASSSSSSSSAGKRNLDRKLSFLSSSQANEIEESGVNASGTFKFSSGL